MTCLPREEFNPCCRIIFLPPKYIKMKMLCSYWDHPNTTASNQPLADLLFFFFLNTARSFRGILLIASSPLPSQCYIFLFFFFYPRFQEHTFYSFLPVSTFSVSLIPAISPGQGITIQISQKNGIAIRRVTQRTSFSIAASWHCCGHSSKGNSAERLGLCQ